MYRYFNLFIWIVFVEWFVWFKVVLLVFGLDFVCFREVRFFFARFVFLLYEYLSLEVGDKFVFLIGDLGFDLYFTGLEFFNFFCFKLLVIFRVWSFCLFVFL